MARARKAAKVETIDFSGVPEEKGGRSRRIPEGDYLAKIISAEKKYKNNDRSNPPFYSWRIQLMDGKYKGTMFYHTTSLKPEALFNLRNLILAATGKNVAGRRGFKFDPQKLYGKVIATSVEDEFYTDKNGKERITSKIVDTRPKEELELDQDEDDEDLEDEDEDEEDEEEEEEEEEDEDEDDELEDVDEDEL